MKDYYNIFVELSLQQCTKSDYLDKAKVKIHNKASKKIQELQVEIKETDNAEVLNLLLSHEDDRVKMNAASMCLQLNVYLNEAIQVLDSIIAYSDDSTMRFSAKMLLKMFQSKEK